MSNISKEEDAVTHGVCLSETNHHPKYRKYLYEQLQFHIGVELRDPDLTTRNTIHHLAHLLIN